jgi:hypothetical protein
MTALPLRISWSVGKGGHRHREDLHIAESEDFDWILIGRSRWESRG